MADPGVRKGGWRKKPDWLLGRKMLERKKPDGLLGCKMLDLISRGGRKKPDWLVRRKMLDLISRRAGAQGSCCGVPHAGGGAQPADPGTCPLWGMRRGF